MIFAIGLAPVALALVFGLDLSRTTRLKATLQSASDAAALAALAPLASGKAADTDVQDVLQANLITNLGSPQDLKITGFSVNVQTTDGVTTAKVTTEASIAPMWSNGPFGSAAKVKVTSTTTTGRASYMDVHFWLDGSASMHMPSSEAGRDKLKQLSAQDPDRPSCQFACHLPTGLAEEDLHYGTSYARAKANGVELRTDVMSEATEEVIEVLSEFNKPVERVRFSIHQFNDSALQLASLTSDTKTLTAELDKMTAVNGPYRYTDMGPGASNMKDTFPAMELKVPQDGTGFTPASRRQFVVIVSDGMQFKWDAVPTGPIPQQACDALKQRGVEIAVIQLRYVPQTDHWSYGQHVEPVINQIGPAMQACASPGYYFWADSKEQIHDAFELLTARLMIQLRVAS